MHCRRVGPDSRTLLVVGPAAQRNLLLGGHDGLVRGVSAGAVLAEPGTRSTWQLNSRPTIIAVPRRITH